MSESRKLKRDIKKAQYTFNEFEKIVTDLLENDIVLSMQQFTQHSNVSCFEHSLYVSYRSYTICRHLGFDYRSAARGGMLHDFFLYDWHTTKLATGMHGFSHPAEALKNANANFELNMIEKDIILKHMFPLTLRIPRYKESIIVSMVDKYCSLMEISRLYTGNFKNI